MSDESTGTLRSQPKPITPTETKPKARLEGSRYALFDRCTGRKHENPFVSERKATEKKLTGEEANVKRLDKLDCLKNLTGLVYCV
jgi:hypothetical protein